MRVTNHYAPITEYMDLLVQEAALIARRLPATARFTQIHFGGGSPTSIRAADFATLIQKLRGVLPINTTADISLEADPRHLEEAKIAAYAQSGVNRLSLGVQDFNQDVLNTINRPQPYHLTHDAVTLARRYGIGSINFDLMYGLPNQTLESLSQTMQMAIALRPDRIAFFGYAHVPWMKKHMRLIPEHRLPDASLRYDLYEAGATLLIEAGYVSVGIDHFVLPGDSMATALEVGRLHRNFQGYTTDDAAGLVGLGTSSISALPNLYAQNTLDLRQYRETVTGGALPIKRGYLFAETDLLYACIIEQLMCNLRVDLKQVAEKFDRPISIFDSEISRLQAFVAQGLITLHDHKITIHEEARLIVRVICQVFDQYASPGPHNTLHNTPRHAQAV